MEHSFIYLLRILIITYENAFKIGCTCDYRTRMPNYGTHLGPHEYESDIIKIISVPDKIKIRYKGKLKNYSNCEYVEAYLHSCYNSLRMCNPTTHCEVEFFNPDSKINKEDIEKILREANIKYRYIGLYDKNDHLEEAIKEWPRKKSKSSKEKMKKTDYDVPPESEREFYEKNCENNGFDFIKEFILLGKELRSIQNDLWNILIKDRENINGLIQWPTGTGKRIAIIMTIITLYIYYKSIGKSFRCVVAANRNDIFDGSAWEEYEKIRFCGLPVFKGSNGKLKANYKEIKDNESFLLITTHHSLVKDKSSDLSEDGNRLIDLDIDCMIYDETQNITSPAMYEYLKNNKPKHLVGISATPETDDEKQNKKIEDLFMCKYLSKCSYKYAIDQGWINNCKFYREEYQNNKEYVLNKINTLIRWRKSRNMWKTRKFIIWVPSGRNEQKGYYGYIKEYYPTWTIYDKLSDFDKDNLNDEPMCLILCQTGREGYDRKDIEFGVHIGDSATHLYIQEQGRSMRKDYHNKLSELLIFCSEDKMYDLDIKIPEYMGDDFIGYLPDNVLLNDNEEETPKEEKEMEEEIIKLQEQLEKRRSIRKEEKEREINIKMSILEKEKREEYILKRDIRDIQTRGEIPEGLKKKIIDNFKIKTPQELSQNITKIKELYSGLRMTDFDFINWSEYDTEKKYYEIADKAIKSIRDIYEGNKIKIRAMKKTEEKHNFYNELDERIPPWNITHKLWNYWGNNEYRDSNFKLEDSN